MGQDNDYVFPEKPQFDDILCGEWDETKSPSSIVMRRFLVGSLRFHRSTIRSRNPKHRREELECLRQLYRTQVAELIKLEPTWLKIRSDLHRTLLPLIRPEGGVQ